MIPVTYGYVRVSKSDRDEKNLETQLRILEEYGIRQEHIFRDVQTGTTFRRHGWRELMAHVRPKDTIAVCWQDRFSRNFDEGVAIQADLTKREIWIVAIRENIDTRDGSAGAKFYRRMMMSQGAYQADSSSERIRAGQDRARAEGRKIGRPPALTPEDIDDCRRLYADGAGYSLRRIARLKRVSKTTVKKAVESGVDAIPP